MGKFKLYKSQKHDVKRILKESTRGALDASVTGAGKTIIGVETMRRAGARTVLIIAPLNTLDGWTKTVFDQTGQKVRQIGNYTPQTKEAILALKRGAPGWFFAGWEFMATRAEWYSYKPDGVIFDELHRASTRSTRTQKMAAGIGVIVERAGGYRLGLSATPFGNKVAGAWGVYKALWPSHVKARYGIGFHRWAKHHLEVQQVQINEEGDTVMQIGGEREPGSITAEFPLYFRHEAKENCCEFHPKGIQAELPARVIHPVGVDMTPVQWRIYRELAKLYIALPEDSPHTIDTEGYEMVLRLRLLQVCLAVPTTEMVKKLRPDPETGELELVDWTKVKYLPDTKSTKIDAIMDILADIPVDEPVIVFTHSRGIIETVLTRIEKVYPGAAQGWHGGVKGRDRDKLKADFIAGKVRILVCQIASIAEGVDGLQRVCHNEIWLSSTNNGVQNTQALGRLNRRGQTQPINSWEIYVRDTVEKIQFENLQASSAVMKKALSSGIRR